MAAMPAGPGRRAGAGPGNRGSRLGPLCASLEVDASLVDRAREAAARIGLKLSRLWQSNTTVSVERAVLRLAGVDGIAPYGHPLPNVLVDQIAAAGGLGWGAWNFLANAVAATGKPVQELAEACGRGELDLTSFPPAPAERLARVEQELVPAGLEQIRRQRRERQERKARLGQSPPPRLYLIVATGNIYEDLRQAQAAARDGADCIAVIRSTAQSLLDYVPFGPTTEGFGGTYATQANFRLMRRALDEVAEEQGRYIELVNYASGLCMPEMATMAALERLDMMLNDAMYGIIFRDINMQRTFVDQYFSRVIQAFAGITINTGEDNYLTTADAVAAAHTVLASQFINERLALMAGIPEEAIGLGHAFEVDPEREDSLLFELAQAALIRAVFPQVRLKYMPPTKHITGDIFRAYMLHGFFNLVGVLTGQDIQLLGMLTEAIHTPFLHDRGLALQNARYVRRAARHLAEALRIAPGSALQARAQRVLRDAVEMLEQIAATGLEAALAQGAFAGIPRRADGGRGLEGVVQRRPGYRNPFWEQMERELGLASPDAAGPGALVPAPGSRPGSEPGRWPEQAAVPLPAPPSRPSSVPLLATGEAEREGRPIFGPELRPYGDTQDDGMVQLSFTLPSPAGPRTKEAARQLVERMGFSQAEVVHVQPMGRDFSFVVVYAHTQAQVNWEAVRPPQASMASMSFDEVNAFIRDHLGRRLVVVGACIESDAHTVGIDAILNMKGYAGEYGLERYPEIRAVNLGAQVPAESLIARAVQEQADAILVSQIVTQKNVHIHNLTKLVDLLEAEGLRDRFVLVVGGPRISHPLAVELGYDAGFGAGTLPGQVAAYLAQEVYARARAATRAPGPRDGPGSATGIKG
ncbi:MAG: cobalamin B12-binding domain-containing protein [Firmicutes bacterium]|nr:cobalamin B12-binding domain-containing protein [Bacillota bacterium]